MQNDSTGPQRELPLALAILQREHEEIVEAFERLENACSASERESARSLLAAAVERHLALEESVFYPTLDSAEGLGAMRRRGEAEHAELRDAMASVGEEGATSNGAVRLARLVFERHRRGEEDEVFPLVQRRLADGLQALAVELEQQREAEKGAYGVG
jgi:hemerythrin-like domain-containing protein